MPTLLSTKLTLPPLRQALLPRPALLAVLAQAAHSSLTLVSAPPGYGKTTLVSAWLREAGLPYAWLSLDEGDNDPVRFLEYFFSALQQVVPSVRLEWLELRQSAQAASLDTLMALVINEAAAAGDFLLALDDFQVLHSPAILGMLDGLLEHLPPTMHLLLLSRSDPPLPLPRLRARGQLLEIRARQLRFTGAEIAQFFARILPTPLSAPQVEAIETRTEGWVAGLQLAGLALRAETDPRRFISAFTGSQAYILDYLTTEVLRGQPEALRDFLLQTSILERMCGPLCAAVLDPDAPARLDGQALLETVERAHLFLVPLDLERRWYRYHHLFKEVLARRLEVIYPDRIPALHRRASLWFEQHGDIHAAIQHARQGQDPDRVAALVEQHGCALLMGGELVTLADWLASIEAYTHTRPWLAMQKAWVLALSAQPERADLAIAAGEQLLAGLDLSAEVRTLRGSFLAARAHWANTLGKTGLAAGHARRAIELLRVGDDFSCALRSVATSILGDASWAEGRLEEARGAYAEAVQIGQAAGNSNMTMMSLISQADLYLEQGQLHQAARLYAQTLQLAAQADGPDSAYAQGAHLGLGRVYYAWNRLAEADEALENACRLALRWQNGGLRAAGLALRAQLALSSGQTGEARAAAAGAQELLANQSLSSRTALWAGAALARFWLAQGQSDPALSFLRETGLPPAGAIPEKLALTAIPLPAPFPYRLLPACLLWMRLLLARGEPAAALALAERLLPEARSSGWGQALIELLVLQSLAFQASRDGASALAALEQAANLAWLEQSRRVFLDEGEAMGKLLYQAWVRGIGGEFVAGLHALREQEALAAAPVPSPAGSPLVPTGGDLLVEPLSQRELEVLRAVADGCSNQEIAARFVLSPLTVKRHISNIYAKLEAKNRTQAVSLARSLKLIV